MSIVCNTSNLNNIDKGTPTNYQLIFPKIPTESNIGANNPFIMNIHTAMLPSVSLANEELRWQGNKTKRGLIPMEFDPWLVSFTVDSLLLNWKLLFDWMNYINNNNDKISGYHGQYSVDCSMVMTDNYGNSVLEVIFVNIWPSQLQEVSFSQREGDILLESSVSFNYDYFYIRNTTTWPIEFSSSSSSMSSSSSSMSSSSLSSSSLSSSSQSSSSSSMSSSSQSSSSSSSLSSSSTSYQSSSSKSSSSSFTIVNTQGGYAPGTGIAFSPSAGGVLGRYVVVDGSTVRYSDDGGENWTTYNNPNGTMENVRWFSQLNGFVCTYLHAIGFSSDGLSFSKTNEINNSYFLDNSNICYSERTNLVWVVSEEGGSLTRIHASSDIITLTTPDSVGLYNQSYGGCSHGQEDYFFSSNYTKAYQCITPDTSLNSWGNANKTPWSVLGANLTNPGRGVLLSSDGEVLAYSGCYNNNPLTSSWVLNNDGGYFKWSKGQYGYNKFWVIGNDGTLRYSNDGNHFVNYGSGSPGGNDCAPGIDRVIIINSSGNCLIARYK